MPDRDRHPDQARGEAPLERFAERRDAAAQRLAERRAAAGERVTGAKAAASERVSEARDSAAEARAAAAERVAEARAVATERVAGAKAVAGERVAEAKDAAAELIATVKPRFRGRSHEWAFFLFLGLGVTLFLAADGSEARLAAGIYAASLTALFGVSALYHRIDWKRPAARAWMRRLDHTMIFFLIAGTITPFALLVMDGPLATALLIAVWAGAAAGTVVEVVWVDRPKWVSSVVYLIVGWIGALGFPAIVVESGAIAGILIVSGALLYTAGAIVYATGRPDPNPAVFGYHEIFHVFVIAAAAAHFAAIAFFALPAAG